MNHPSTLILNNLLQNIITHIFERLYQCGHSRSVKGNGLGLAIAKELVIVHKGVIIANSTPGKGTEFVISLPKAL